MGRRPVQSLKAPGSGGPELGQCSAVAILKFLTVLTKGFTILILHVQLVLLVGNI